jgi:hypothetical protein
MAVHDQGMIEIKGKANRVHVYSVDVGQLR